MRHDVEAIARLGSALGSGVKMAVDLAKMAVGLPPTAVSMAETLDLAARASGPPAASGSRDELRSTTLDAECAPIAEDRSNECGLPDLWSLGDGLLGRPLIGSLDAEMSVSLGQGTDHR